MIKKNLHCFADWESEKDELKRSAFSQWTAFRHSLWGQHLISLSAEQLSSLETQGLEALKAWVLAGPEEEDLAEGDLPSQRDPHYPPGRTNP